MTGTGTQANPYVPENWAELKTAAEQENVYIRLSAYGEWDMNDQYPEDAPGIELRAAEIEGNGTTIKNLRKASGELFYSRANTLILNLFLPNMYISNSTVFHCLRGGVRLLNVSIGGELYSSMLWSCDYMGVNTDRCSISLYLNNSEIKINPSSMTNTAIDINGTVISDVGDLSLHSSAIYGSIRSVGAQRAFNFSGELSVVDIALQNFSYCSCWGDGTTIVLNIDKIGEATIGGNTPIEATTAQMMDAAWLNAAGFPCRAG